MTEHSDSDAEGASERKSASAIRNPTVIGIGGGVAAGIASSFIPMGAIEGFVSAYGIAELLPAAAPPLGNTARLALSTGIGTLTAGALLALLPRGETNDMGFETTVRKDTGPDHTGMNDTSTLADSGEAVVPAASAGFGASKLGGWLRTLRFGKTAAAPGEITDFADLTRNRIRIKDQHPDAPVRAPIFASSDLGDPLDAPVDVPPSLAVTRFEQLPVVEPQPIDEQTPLTLGEHLAVPVDEDRPQQPAPPLRFTLPTDQPDRVEDAETAIRASRPFKLRAPESDTESVLMPEPEAASEAASELHADEDHSSDTPAMPNDLEQLSIPQLLARLESGLQRRTAQVQPLAGAVEAKPPAEGRLFRLAQVDQPVPTSPAFVPPDAAESHVEDDTPPFRFRLDRTADADDAGESRLGTLAGRNEWNGEIEYQPPVIGSGYEGGRNAPADPMPPVETIQPQVAPSDTIPQPADDDMDAALRDALATLRQLSDRQRNV